MNRTDADDGVADLALVQLGSVDVHPDVLRGPGTDLATAIGPRPLLRDSWDACQAIRALLPSAGWRVAQVRAARGSARAAAALAAPCPGEPGAWVLAFLAEDNGQWLFSGDPEPARPRPGRAARRRYLRLDCPAVPVIAAAGQPPDLSLRLTNTGASGWGNGPDIMRVLAWITDPRTGEPLPAQRTFAQAGSEHFPVELAAGESIIIPARTATRDAGQLPPGSYGLTALLTAVNLRSAPGTLHLT